MIITWRSSCHSQAPACRPRAELISMALRHVHVWSDVNLHILCATSPCTSGTGPIPETQHQDTTV